MGWTHTWQRATELDADGFKRAVADCRNALDATRIPLAGFDGTGNPVFEDEHIVFNGVSPASCEPFEIARIEFDRRGKPQAWGFCKTEHQPYDLCVQVALVILNHHLGSSIEIGSDGTVDDWSHAIDHVKKLLGYGAGFQLTNFD